MSTQPLTLVPKIWGEPLKPRREILWLQEGKKCHWCGRPTRLVEGDSGDQATIDHVIPRYKGGSNDINNLVSSCRDCNGRRNTEDMRGLPEGHLLGKNWKSFANGTTSKVSNVISRKKYVVLSADEKKALMAKMDAKIPVRHILNEDVLKEQRDQGLKKIAELQKQVDQLKSVINDLESMTLGSMIRKRLAQWILDGSRKP